MTIKGTFALVKRQDNKKMFFYSKSKEKSKVGPTMNHNESDLVKGDAWRRVVERGRVVTFNFDGSRL